MDACTVAAFDVITAFAVPNPNCPSQSQSVFSGLEVIRVASVTNHPAYFGLANFIKPILSAIDVSKGTVGATRLSTYFLAGVYFSVGVFVENRIEYWKSWSLLRENLTAARTIANESGLHDALRLVFGQSIRQRPSLTGTQKRRFGVVSRAK